MSDEQKPAPIDIPYFPSYNERRKVMKCPDCHEEMEKLKAVLAAARDSIVCDMYCLSLKEAVAEYDALMKARQ